jgi:hypothetical protein
VSPETLETLVAYIEEQRAAVRAAGTGKEGYNAAAEYAKNIAEAAFNFASSDAGLSGFQAGWASLHLFAKLRGVEGPMAVLEAERFLYPQHGTVFHMAGKLNEDWTPWLAKEARRLMAEHPERGVAAEVWAHWERLAARDAGDAS